MNLSKLFLNYLAKVSILAKMQLDIHFEHNLVGY